MRTVIFFLFALAVPLSSWAEGITFADSPDWKSMDPTKVEMFRKQASQSGGLLLDAASATGGSPGCLSVSTPMKSGVNKQSADQFVTGFIHGVEGTGAKLASQEPAVVQSLRGRSIAFQAHANGQDSTILAYVLFATDKIYILSFYGGKGMTRSDPLVASYLSRVKVDPSVIPGNVDALSSAEFGDLVGRTLVWKTIGGVVIGFIVMLIFRSRKQTAAVRPPPLP